MATKYTDIASTVNNSKGLHDRQNDARYSSGDVKRIVATYTTEAGLAQGDVIRIARIPKGALVDGVNASLRAESGFCDNDDTVVKVGVSYDDGSTGNDDALGSFDVTRGTINPFAGGDELAPVEFTKAGWIEATLSTFSNPTAGKKLIFLMDFLIAG